MISNYTVVIHLQTVYQLLLFFDYIRRLSVHDVDLCTFAKVHLISYTVVCIFVLLLFYFKHIIDLFIVLIIF